MVSKIIIIKLKIIIIKLKIIIINLMDYYYKFDGI